MAFNQKISLDFLFTTYYILIIFKCIYCNAYSCFVFICSIQESGAFVYGAMSFLDKISNGLVIQFIELLNPSNICHPSANHPALLFLGYNFNSNFATSTAFDNDHQTTPCANFYRNVMAFVPGACAIIILLVLATFDLRTLARRNYFRFFQRGNFMILSYFVKKVTFSVMFVGIYNRNLTG